LIFYKMSLKPYPQYAESGINWLTSYPCGWEMLKIKYLFAERVEKGFPDEPLLAATQTKGVIPKYLFETRTVLAQKDLHLLKLVEPGDFVISLRSFQGGIEKAYYRGIISPAYTILKPNERINSGYFKHLAKSKPFIKLLTTCVTGIREGQNIDYDVLRRSKLPVPPINEQLQISRFLDWKTSQINKLIKAKKRQIELLKEQKQVIINDTVIGKIDVRTGKPYPKYKDTGIEWLPKVPDDWDIFRLRNIAKVQPSGIDKISKPDEIQVKLCNYTDVYNNDIIDNSIPYMIASTTEEELNNFILREDDVIITKDSEDWKDIAVPAYVPNKLPNVVCAYHLALIRTNKQKLIGEFLFYLFSSQALLHQFRISANGVTRFGLPQGAIKDGLFPIPSLNLQQQICNFIKYKSKRVELLLDRTFNEINLLQEYRSRLIADVVTGKFDVRDIKFPQFAEEAEAPGFDEAGADEFEGGNGRKKR